MKVGVGSDCPTRARRALTALFLTAFLSAKLFQPPLFQMGPCRSVHLPRQPAPTGPPPGAPAGRPPATTRPSAACK